MTTWVQAFAITTLVSRLDWDREAARAAVLIERNTGVVADDVKLMDLEHAEQGLNGSSRHDSLSG